MLGDNLPRYELSNLEVVLCVVSHSALYKPFLIFKLLYSKTTDGHLLPDCALLKRILVNVKRFLQNENFFR
jgi:hypothetical protein